MRVEHLVLRGNKLLRNYGACFLQENLACYATGRQIELADPRLRGSSSMTSAHRRCTLSALSSVASSSSYLALILLRGFFCFPSGKQIQNKFSSALVPENQTN